MTVIYKFLIWLACKVGGHRVEIYDNYGHDGFCVVCEKEAVFDPDKHRTA